MDESIKLCYYEILGIKREANLDEVRKAYRKQSLKWHPDKNVDNKEEAEQKFKKISEAYQVLSDSEKRKQYDLYGFNEENTQTQDYMPEFNFRSSNDIFREFFGNDPFMSSFFSMSGHQPGFGFMPFPNFPSFHGFGNSTSNMFNGQSLFNDPFFTDPFDDPFFSNSMHHTSAFNSRQTFLNGAGNFPSLPGFMGNQLHSISNGISFSTTTSFTDGNGVTRISQQSFGPSTQYNSTSRRVETRGPSSNSRQIHRQGNGERYTQVGQNTNPRNHRPY